MNRKQRKELKKLNVALYDCNQAYGGPEEGGWWFNTGEFLSIEGTYFNRISAIQAVHALKGYCKRVNEGKPPIDSVMCAGVIQAKIQKGPFAVPYFPARRPHYE